MKAGRAFEGRRLAGPCLKGSDGLQGAVSTVKPRQLLHVRAQGHFEGRELYSLDSQELDHDIPF